MANGMKTSDLRGFNKGRSLKFIVGFRVRQIPEEDRRTYRTKRSRNSYKDEDNSPKTLNDEIKVFENYSILTFKGFEKTNRISKMLRIF